MQQPATYTFITYVPTTINVPIYLLLSCPRTADTTVWLNLPPAFRSPVEGDPIQIPTRRLALKKTRIPGRCLHDPTSSHFSRTPTCDRHRHAKTAYSPPSQLTTVATVTCQKMLSRSICLLSWAFMAWSINMCTIHKTTMLLLHTKLISMTVVSCCCSNLK